MAANASQRLTAWLFRNHRWFGVLPSLFVIMWGMSGVLHPIMSRLSPQAAVSMSPSQSIRLHEALEPKDVLQKAGIASVSALRVVEMEGESYYQVTSEACSNTPSGRPLPNPPPLTQGRESENRDARCIDVQTQRRYFNINSGEELIDGDTHYARLLARHFTGDTQSAIISTKLIENFDDDYLSTNRLLPVYRIDFARADELRIYIETNPGRAATLVDNTKATLSGVFLWMHTWAFMAKADVLRKIIITALLVATLLSALSGLWIYGFMWRRHTLSKSHTPLRRWHRTVGISVALTTILFVVSAMWHLLGSEPRDVPEQVATRIKSESLLLPPSIRHNEWGVINAVTLDGRTYYQVMKPQQPSAHPVMSEHAEHDKPREQSAMSKQDKASVQYVAAENSEPLEDSERKHAISLATQYSGIDSSKIVGVEMVTQFSGEYGFINKRLPVWLIQFDTDDHVAFYVETSSGALASVVRDADRYEGYSFAYLHKYHWLDFAGKNVRDFVMALFGLGTMLVAALGLWMFVRRSLTA